MATTQTTMDIVNSLAMNDIPIKLRCASCNKLVLDAFRLPCCDQNICGSCQATLPETCLVCDHSPIAAADCKPNKALRLTIKAFLKSEEKKREKQNNLSVPQTPVAPTTPSSAEVDSSATLLANSAIVTNDKDIEDNTDLPVLENTEKPEQDSELRSQAEVNSRTGATQAESGDNAAYIKGNKTEQSSEVEGQTVSHGAQRNVMGNHQLGTGNNSGHEVNWNQIGNFNPMMQMQMQNSMANGGWGFPNMMAMGMNPMDMSQGMFGGFGMQNMGGMHGMMNNGMNFNSGYGWNNAQFTGNPYGGAAGGYNQGVQGQFGQFSQNRFQNPNGFDANAAPQRTLSVAAQSKSNQGPSSVKQSGELSIPDSKADTAAGAEEQPVGGQDHNSDGKVDFMSVAEHDTVNGALDVVKTADEEGVPTPQISSAHEADSMNDSNNVSVHGQELSVLGANDASIFNQQPDHEYQQENHDMAHNDYSQYAQNGFGHMQPPMYVQNGMQGVMGHGAYDNNNMAYQTPQQAQGVSFAFNTNGRGRGAGGWRGRGNFQAHQTDQPPFVRPIGQGVEGAPTGPRAMRDGLPNRGNFRGRGSLHMQRDGRQDVKSSTAGSNDRTPSVVPPTNLEDDRPLREADDYSEGTRSRTRSRRTSRDGHRRREHKSRSRSVSSHQRPNDRKSRGHGHGLENSCEHVDDASHRRNEQADNKREHSRSSSVESSRRYRSHRSDKERQRSSRSHRDSSRERRRHRHRSRSPVSDHDRGEEHPDEHSSSRIANESKSRKSRSERRRDRDREHDEDRAHEKDKSRRRDGDRDRDRERRREREREDRRRSRKERSASRETVDEPKSSRRHRHHREEEERGKRSRTSPEADGILDRSKVPDAPRQQAEDDDQVEFKIQGRAKQARAARPDLNVFNPPTGPAAARAPPTGPRALLTKISTMNPPSGPASARKGQLPTPAFSETTSTPPTPALDPHTMEREARNRERMLKEEQRRSQMGGSGGSDRKRSYADQGDDNDDGFAPPSGPRGDRDRDRDRRKKSRRVNYKYEDEENSEARARRVEDERESSRWH